MVIQFVAAASGQTGSSSSLTVAATIPPAAQVGHFAVCHVAQERGDAGLVLSNAGWTVLGRASNAGGQLTYLTAKKVLTADDLGKTVTGTVTAGRRMSMIVDVYSGVADAALVQGSAAATGTGSNTTPGGTATPAADDSLLVATMTAVRNASPWQMRFTESANWTERADVVSQMTTGANPTAVLADRLLVGSAGTVQQGPTWSAIEMTSTAAVTNQFAWPGLLVLTPGVAAAPTTVTFTATPSGLAVACDASASSGVTGTVGWTFGDGGTATGLSVQHTYAAAGTYTVTAKDSGSGVQTSKQVTVAAPAAPSATPAYTYLAGPNGWVAM